MKKTVLIVIPIVCVVATAAITTTVLLLKKSKPKTDTICTGDACAWACKDGECVNVAAGEGTWTRAEDCRCGLCGDDGECEATSSGGAYRSVSECKQDDASMCSVELGWGCDPDAGNAQMCGQVTGGAATSRDACRCWACVGKPPGPASVCVYDGRGSAAYATEKECFENEVDKCGWKYACTK